MDHCPAFFFSCYFFVANGTTPLLHAAIGGSLDCLKALHDAGASIDVVDDENSTALHKACFFGNVECAEYLIRKGCNLNAV